MAKPTLSTVAEKIPRETAGSDAFRAFDFQVNVAMSLILDLHGQGKEYVVVFDHHDDLILSVGDAQDSELSFYQVKSTSELTWTAKRLTRRNPKGDLPKSIVGKAFYNVAQFGPGIRRAAILSNRPLNATLASATAAALHDGELALTDLSLGEHRMLLRALKADFPNGFDESHAKLLKFERVPLDLESYRTTVLGKVVTMLEGIDPDLVVCSNPFYKALLAAVGECTRNKAKSATVEELMKRVALRSSDINQVIARVQARPKSLFEWWPSVEAELFPNGRQALQSQRLRNRCLSYHNARRLGQKSALDLRDVVREAIEKSHAGHMDSIGDAIVALSTWGLVEPSSEPYHLEAAMIVELMESEQ